MLKSYKVVFFIFYYFFSVKVVLNICVAFVLNMFNSQRDLMESEKLADEKELSRRVSLLQEIRNREHYLDIDQIHTVDNQDLLLNASQAPTSPGILVDEEQINLLKMLTLNN